MRTILFLAFLCLATATAAHEVERTLPDADCSVPAQESWSESESWAWGEICAGRVADMSLFSGEGAGCDAWIEEGEPTPWPDARVLSADFIRTIATRHHFTEAPARPTVRIRCALVQGFLDFADETLPQTFWLDDSRLPDGMSLQYSQVSGGLKFDGTALGGSSIVAIGARVTKDLIARNARFPRLELNGARISGNLALIGSTFTGPFQADGVEVGGSLFLREEATFKAGVRLVRATVGQTVEADGSTFGPFEAEGLEVGGDLFMRSAIFEGTVNLRGSRIADALQLVGSIFHGEVVLAEAVIGMLQLTHGLEMHMVDEKGIVLQTTLMPGFDGSHPIWESGASLILRNAHVGALQAAMPVPSVETAHHAWRRKRWEGSATSPTYEPLPVDLANFTYDRLGGVGEDPDNDVTRVRTERLITWIEQSVAPGHTAEEGYFPQPYMQLAKTLRAGGAAEAANAVDYARLKHRVSRRENLWAWILDGAAWVFVGFGVYPQRAVYWFGGLVTAGWIVTIWSSDLRNRGPFERFFYSLENSLPLIDLSHGFQNMTHGGNRAVANFFHFQKIAGFLLASILVGALTIFAS